MLVHRLRRWPSINPTWLVYRIFWHIFINIPDTETHPGCILNLKGTVGEHFSNFYVTLFAMHKMSIYKIHDIQV